MSSEKLDWSDPKKLQRRDGGEVLACWTEESGFSHGTPQYWAVSLTPKGQREVVMYTPRGNYGVCPMDRDIIPRPREPRTIDGWVRLESFTVEIGKAFWVGHKKPDTNGNFVRVRITEVLDE